MKLEPDFYMDFPFNRSEKLGNLIPKSEFVTFEPGNTYDKSVVRRFLFEYISKRVSYSRRNPEQKNDVTRYWYIGKAVKDYIILTGKHHFTFEEV
jgi:hypothetical protein